MKLARNNNAALMKNSKHSVPCTNTEALYYSLDHSIIKQSIFASNITQIVTIESLIFISIFMEIVISS